jgi:2'-5' RNA ligase
VQWIVHLLPFTLYPSTYILYPLNFMTQPPSGQKYSLWFMLQGEALNRLTEILHRLSIHYEAPEFPPHVTLLGSCVGERDEMIRRSSLVAAALRPFTIRLGKIDFRDEYFRSLFVHAGPAEPLRNAYRAASRIFRRAPDPDFMPHLSLLYGNFPVNLKEDVMAELGPRLDVRFKVRSLHLYHTQGAVQNWQQVESFGLR